MRPYFRKCYRVPRPFKGPMLMEERETKGERRDHKRRKMREMRVVGRSVKLLQQIIRRRAEKLKDKGTDS